MKGFTVGDRVHHVGRSEDGTVVSLTHEAVHVEFDQPTPGGRPSIGIFDEVWFNTHEGWLKPTDTGSMT